MKTTIAKPGLLSPDRQYAGFKKRLLAFGVDYLVILGYIAALVGVTFSLQWATSSLGQGWAWPENPIAQDVLAFFTLILPVVLYFILSESSSRQATWGKRKAGIHVVNAVGERLTRKQALVRSLLKFLPWQIAHTSIFHIQEVVPGQEPAPFDITGFVLVWVLVGIYVISALISKERRTPYDWAAGSYVIVTK